MKLLLTTLMLAVLVFYYTEGDELRKAWNEWTLPLSNKVIVLDAGHGGPDGGAESRDGIIEKHINLAIALYIRDYLQQAGAIVYMTREDDSDLASNNTKGLSRRKTEDLLNRVKFVREKKADLLVSIHLNSIPSTRWRGAQTFYYPTNTQGKILATWIQNEIKNTIANTDRLANTVNTVYLLKALDNIPGALVEIGFLSNPEEARLLGDETYQKKMAEAIYRGILRYASGEKIGTS
ncbi:N-acetylmuramoyl-L-alanine amidase CwlD [Ferviditalea candida]